MNEKGFVGGVAVRVPNLCLGMPQRTIAAGVHIGRTAGQNKGVKSLQLFFELIRRLVKSDFFGVGPGTPSSLEIKLEFVPLLVDLFLGGTPRDAHTGTLGGAQLRVSMGHGTPNRSIRSEGRQPMET